MYTVALRQSTYITDIYSEIGNIFKQMTHTLKEKMTDYKNSYLVTFSGSIFQKIMK